MIDELREKHRFTSARAGQPQNWYSFSSGVTSFTYGANFCQGGKVRGELYIDLGDGDRNNKVFDLLEQKKDEIGCTDVELSQVMEWHVASLRRLKKNLGPKLKSLAPKE